MLSKEMYILLKKIPRREDWISYAELNPSGDKRIDSLLNEAKYDDYDYINQGSPTNDYRLINSTFSLTEKGQAAIEEHEQAIHNQVIVEQSLKVATTAKWAAVFSAIVALLSLIKTFC